MGRLSNSWHLTKETWHLLMKDKELMFFPVLSFIVSMAALFMLFIPVFLLMISGSGGAFIGFLIATYLLYFIAVFFNAGVMCAANLRINGKDPSFGDGIKGAASNVHKLFLWTLLAATVGLILSSMSKRGLLANIVRAVVGLAWDILTFFVLPVLLFEKKGVVDSIKRSGEIFRKTWGEAAVGNISIGLITGWAAGAGIAVLVLLLIFEPVLFPILAVPVLVYILLVTIIGSTLGNIFKVVLYTYATSKKIPKGFSPDLVKNVYRKKGAF